LGTPDGVVVEATLPAELNADGFTSGFGTADVGGTDDVEEVVVGDNCPETPVPNDRCSGAVAQLKKERKSSVRVDVAQ